MYVILTSKDGEFRTEPTEGLRPVETHDYYFYDRHKADFVIAELSHETKVRVIGHEDAHQVNLVPTKFLPRFASLAQARAELATLTQFGSLQTRLVPRT